MGIPEIIMVPSIEIRSLTVTQLNSVDGLRPHCLTRVTLKESASEYCGLFFDEKERLLYAHAASSFGCGKRFFTSLHDLSQDPFVIADNVFSDFSTHAVEG